MKSQKKVAILLAIYNGSKYLKDFLLSLDKQVYKNFDLICIDDLSDDDSINIIKEFQNKINIIFINNNTKLGAAGAFFKLIEKSNDIYDYYLFADQDDVWDKEKVASSIVNLESLPADEPNLYTHKLELVDEELNHLSYAKTPKYITFENALVQNVFPGCTMAFNHTAKKIIVENIPNSKYIMHDWWLYLLVSSVGNISYDEKPLIKYRQHSNNTVGMASSFYNEYKIRLLRFFSDDKQGVFGIAHQADYFIDVHFKKNSRSHLRAAERLSSKNKCISNRTYMFFFTDLKRQTFLDNIMLRIILLIGKY